MLDTYVVIESRYNKEWHSSNSTRMNTMKIKAS